MLTPESHTIVFEGHEYWQYLLPSVIVWALARCLRVARLVYCNVHVRLSKGKLINISESRMEYDEAADVVRLEVTPGIASLHARPGNYYFVYQPLRLTGWENHPFTVGACVADPPGPLLQVSGKPRNSFDHSQLPLLSETVSGLESHDATESQTTGSSTPRLIFWIPCRGPDRHSFPYGGMNQC